MKKMLWPPLPPWLPCLNIVLNVSFFCWESFYSCLWEKWFRFGVWDCRSRVSMVCQFFCLSTSQNHSHNPHPESKKNLHPWHCPIYYPRWYTFPKTLRWNPPLMSQFRWSQNDIRRDSPWNLCFPFQWPYISEKYFQNGLLLAYYGSGCLSFCEEICSLLATWWFDTCPYPRPSTQHHPMALFPLGIQSYWSNISHFWKWPQVYYCCHWVLHKVG